MSKLEQEILSTQNYINSHLSNINLFAVYARREIGKVFILLPLSYKEKYLESRNADPKLEVQVYLLDWMSKNGLNAFDRKEVVFSNIKELQIIENCYSVF